MGWWGWVASPRQKNTAIRAQTVVLCSQQTTGMYTNHRIDRDSHWKQFGTQPILISAPQWACWPCNASTRSYTVGKKSSVKADLAIYSQAVYVRGQCMTESLKLGRNLDFSSCDIMVGFHKSSHIYVYVYEMSKNLLQYQMQFILVRLALPTMSTKLHYSTNFFIQYFALATSVIKQQHQCRYFCQTALSFYKHI